MIDEDSIARVKLAGRILLQSRCGGGPPNLLSEIAQLRFLAESDEERALPLDRLAQIVIEREGKTHRLSTSAGLRDRRKKLNRSCLNPARQPLRILHRRFAENE